MGSPNSRNRFVLNTYAIHYLVSKQAADAGSCLCFSPGLTELEGLDLTDTQSIATLADLLDQLHELQVYAVRLQESEKVVRASMSSEQKRLVSIARREKQTMRRANEPPF